MRTSWFGAVVAVLALAASGRAEDGYTIKLKHGPDVGKTITIKNTETRSVTSKVTDSDGNVLDKGTKHTQTEDEVYTETVLAKGDKYATRYKRAYEKATRTRDGKTEARSFQGRTLVFEEKGGKFTVTAEGDKPIDKEDLDELTHKAEENKNDMATGDVFLPEKPVKVDGTWKVDGKDLVKALAANGELDPQRSSAEGKLVKVYQKKVYPDQDGRRFGTLELTLKLAPAKAPPGVTFDKPPVVETKLTLDAAIDGSTTYGVMTMTGSSVTKATVEQMGKKFTADTTVELSGRREQSAEK